MSADDNDTELNRRAFFALRGFSADWSKDLIALLRSSEPIHPVVRETLADALESGTPDGTRLELTGNKKNADLFKGIDSRYKWMEIGEFIEDLIKGGKKKKDALPVAVDKFAASREKCDAALTYYRRTKRWLATATVPPAFAQFINHGMREHIPSC